MYGSVCISQKGLGNNKADISIFTFKNHIKNRISDLKTALLLGKVALLLVVVAYRSASIQTHPGLEPRWATKVRLETPVQLMGSD